MTSKHATKRLEDLILAAAFLHREFLGQRATERFLEKDGARISYVFDHGIIEAYSAPWYYGPQQYSEGGSRTEGMGQLLPRLSNALHTGTEDELDDLRADEDVRAQNVTRMLSEYCLQLNNETPFIWQFEPHFEETDRGINRVNRMADEAAGISSADATDQLMKNATLILRARLNQLPNQFRTQEVAQCVNMIAGVYLRRENYGPNKALRQRERLDKLSTKFSARKILRHFSDLMGVALPEPSAYADEQHQRAFQLLKRFWRRALSSDRSKREDSSNDRDAECLARLAVLNKRLLDAENHHRIVFVTGSSGLVKLAYGCGDQLQTFLRDSAIEEVHRGRSREEIKEEYEEWNKYFGFGSDHSSDRAENYKWFNRLSLHYIRHQWAFAKDALIESSETKKLENLFHGLFALRAQRAAIKRSEIEELIARRWTLKISIPETDPDALYKSSLTQWDQLIQRSVEQSIEGDLKLTKKAQESLRRKFPGSSGTNAEDVARLIKELVDRQRDRSMLELSDMGAMSLILQKKQAVRYPPDLFFASISNTTKIFQNLFDNVYEHDHTRFARDYNDIQRDCLSLEETETGDDRQLSYLKFLALGAVFASTEKWATALGHATRAISTVKRYPQEPVAVKTSGDRQQEAHMSGREAYFLAAVCKRMVAKSGHDPVVDGMSAADYLAEARKAYASDLDVKPTLKNRLDALRFDCEELAQALSDYYFGRWTDSQEGKGADLQKYDLTQVYGLASSLADQLKISGDEYRPFGGATTFQTQISIATDILQVSTIRAFRADNGILDIGLQFRISDALVERCVTFLKTLKDRPPSVETSLVKVYKNAGGVVLGRLDLTEFRSEADVATLFKCVSPAQVLIYDPWRFDMLERFLLKKVSELLARIS